MINFITALELALAVVYTKGGCSQMIQISTFEAQSLFSSAHAEEVFTSSEESLN